MDTMESTALAIPERTELVALFTKEGGIDPIIARIEAEVRSHVPDVTTKRGRDAIASLAYKVARSKTTLDEAGKSLTEEQRRQINVVDAARCGMLTVSVEMLHRLLICDAEAGKLTWKARDGQAAWNTRYAGKEALIYVSPDGYHRGAVLGRNYQAHRVIWAMAHGAWPADQIDHINGDRTDNRIANLRDVTQAQNKANGGKWPGRNPTSRFIGVERVAATGKWGATVPFQGKRNWCGTFETEEAAARARDAKAIELRGAFARLNFPQVAA